MNANVQIPLVVCLEEMRKRETAKNPRWKYMFSFEAGRKYTRVVISSSLDDGPYNNVRVFLFVNNTTGEVYKTDGHKKTADSARFNLLDNDSFQKMKQSIDPHGYFLYKI